MSRRLAFTSALFAAMLTVTCAPVFAQAPHPGAKPANQNPQARKGFLDYTLGKINPTQNDYGSRVELGRHVVVQQTIESAFFWSNVFSLSLLAGVTTLYLLNLRSGDKKELIAATLITELWNGRVSDKVEIAKIERLNKFIDERNIEIERSLQMMANPKSSETRTDSRTQRKVDRLVDGPKSVAMPETDGRGLPMRTGYSARTPDPPSVVDLQQHNLLLERRIEAMRNTEQNLKERLNQTTSLLEQERKRNQALKGA